MKVRTGLLAMVMSTGMLWAQNPSTAKPAASSAPQTKTTTATTTTSKKSTSPAPSAATKTTTTTTTKSSSPSGTTKTTTHTKTTAAKSTAKKAAVSTKAESAEKNEAAKPKTMSVSSQKRDPFISPVQSHVNGPVNCGTGKRCLVVDQTMLEGIVKAPNGMIAVVSNSANKAYFLRENDPVYNGYVMRITPDSVVFREEVTDRMGRKSTREIVKKVNAPAV